MENSEPEKNNSIPPAIPYPYYSPSYVHPTLMRAQLPVIDVCLRMQEGKGLAGTSTAVSSEVFPFGWPLSGGGRKVSVLGKNANHQKSA